MNGQLIVELIILALVVALIYALFRFPEWAARYGVKRLRQAVAECPSHVSGRFRANHCLEEAEKSLKERRWQDASDWVMSGARALRQG